MKSTELRILDYLRENMERFQEQIDRHAADVTEAKVSFGKKVDTYNSEVLWKIQHCEETLKECAREKRVVDLNRMHMNEVNLSIKAFEKAMKDTVKEVNDRFTLRVK